MARCRLDNVAHDCHKPDMNYERRKPDGAVKSLVILLHGLGANGADLISLADSWRGILPQTLFISPDAPDHCDMAPVGYKWFSLQSRDPSDIARGVENAHPLLQTFITDRQQEHSIATDRTALVGFSQGTMMALHTGLRTPEPIAGILGYSGALAAAPPPPSEPKTRIRLIHGEADDVVPVGALHHVEESLRNAGYAVKATTTPHLGHGIDTDGLANGGAFLKEIIG